MNILLSPEVVSPVDRNPITCDASRRKLVFLPVLSLLNIESERFFADGNRQKNDLHSVEHHG